MASVVEIIIRTIDQGSKQGVDGVSASLGKLVGQYLSVAAVAGTAYKVMSDSIRETAAYAESVRKLSAVSGQSTENTSRLIQVIDDYKLSTDDAMAATRALTKEGKSLSTDSLAQLSDEYLKLNSAQERNDFVLKNLGKSGLQWTEVLQQGGKAIREQSAGIADNLVLTKQMVDAAYKNEQAVDAWNDAVMGLKVSLGNQLLPIMTDFITNSMHLDEVRKRRNKFLEEGMSLSEANAAATKELENELYRVSDASNLAADGTDNLADSQKAAEEAAKSLSDIYTGMLSSMFNIQQQNESYAQSTADFAKKEEDLNQQKTRTQYELFQAREKQTAQQKEYAHDLTNATTAQQRHEIQVRKTADANEFLTKTEVDYQQKLVDIDQQLSEVSQDKAKAAEDNKKAGQQRVYDLTQQKLAADGVISTGEYEYLQNLAVAKGLVTRAAADQAIAENQQADQLVENFGKTQGPMDTALSTMQAISAFDGRIVNFGVAFSTSGMSSLAGMGGTSNPGGYHPLNYSPSSSYTTGGPLGRKSRDSGGSGIAGTPYLIGTGAQPELFTPATNGTFTPAGKMGNNYYITINNPVPQKSVNDIRQALQNLSYLGRAQP